MTGGAAVPTGPGRDGDSDEVVTGDRLATDLLRTARERTDTLPTRTGLAACLRGALLADLALRGSLADLGGAPEAVGEPPADDRILAAVHRTVAARRNVSWIRWFRHVDADLTALTSELLDAGRWTDVGGRLGRHSFRDRDDGGALLLGLRARAVGLGEEEPASAREAVLGVLAVSLGGAHGEARPKAVIALPKVLARFDDVEPARLQAAHAAVGHARIAQRKRRRKVF